jgi:NitT/TauT family transport system substrate-binding protein
MDRFGRRELLRRAGQVSVSAAGLAVLAGCGYVGRRAAPASVDAPPETTTLRLGANPSICLAALYLAEDLLPAEGFTDVRYVPRGPTGEALTAGEADISVTDVGNLIKQVDAGDPHVALAGLHVGCYELFGNGSTRTISDLKGRSVGVTILGSGRHLFLASMVAYVGLNPLTDVNWVTSPAAEAIQLFADGKIDAFMGFPPEPQELRTRKIGHVIVSTLQDRPWSDYYCCYVFANSDFVRRHPIATKRALRAIVKANEICASDPARVAQFLVDRQYTPAYDPALQTMKEIPYVRWREPNLEDAIRFHGVRFFDNGMIKNGPNVIIERGTDWRYINELKQELKA